ncbi:condensation domain-containing protein [Micromonospora sp. NPDC049559]|uniref:condensation domain-containing protein n=1 Tax=Micromonospora sp. NPDC049559 TaxID=3155923 RepID=UPI003423DCBB
MHPLPTVPPSPAQALLEWVEQVDPKLVRGPRFVAVGAYELRGPIDVPALREALDALVVRHEALRTATVRDGGAPVRRRTGEAAPVPLVECPPDRLIDTIVAGRYPADSVPLLWAFLARPAAAPGGTHGADADGAHADGADAHGAHAHGSHADAATATLVLLAQHTVADPWSMRILVADLMEAYGQRLAERAPDAPPVPATPSGTQSVPATPPGTPPVPATPATKQSGSPTAPPASRAAPREEVLEFWRRELARLPALPLPEAAPGGPARTEEERFPVPVTEPRLRSAARGLRTTPFVLLFGAFAGALAELTGATELAVPVLTYGRGRADWDRVGLFMNVLPVRVDLAGDPDPRQALARVHAAFATAYARELPLAELLARVPETARFFAPGGPVSAQFEVIQLPPLRSSGPLAYRPVRLPAGLPLGGPVLPVNGLAVWLEQDADGGYDVTIRYRADLFRPETVDRLALRYADRLDRLVRP